MRTIVFYSYKGGVGKSLTAANLAALISRRGETAALLDLDFNAPSIHTKFSATRAAIPGEPPGGFLRYFMSCVKVTTDPTAYPLRFEDRNALKHFIDSWAQSKSADEVITFDAPPPLDAQAVTTLPPQPKRGIPGTIHLIPSGNIFSREYWPLALGIPFRRVTGFEYDKQAGAAGDIFYQDCKAFFALIKQQITELEPSPGLLDYRPEIWSASTGHHRSDPLGRNCGLYVRQQRRNTRISGRHPPEAFPATTRLSGAIVCPWRHQLR